jgi:chromosome transmission fidelity protein 4
MHLHITRDALGDEDLPDEILARELALDKELVQLIQTACKNDKLPRALELTRMLHHASSFDMAVKVAGFYRLIGLQEKMQALKDDRIARGERRQRRRDWARDYDPVLPPHLPPADVSRAGGSKAFQDFGPPAAVHRPGLARATPSLPPPPPPNDDYVPAAAMNGESKRKWADEDGDVTHGGGAAQVDIAKRRAVDDDQFTARPSSSRPSASISSRLPPIFLPYGLRWFLKLTSRKPEANPFAKKPSGAADGLRNPFARDGPNNKSLHKSESFFDKAEAAETGKWKGLSRTFVVKINKWHAEYARA